MTQYLQVKLVLGNKQSEQFEDSLNEALRQLQDDKCKVQGVDINSLQMGGTGVPYFVGCITYTAHIKKEETNTKVEVAKKEAVKPQAHTPKGDMTTTREVKKGSGWEVKTIKK